jgi:Flp pilus assembly protein TadD
MLGTVLKQQGDADGALREFKETIRINPSSPEAYNSMAPLLRAAHDDQGAADALAQAQRLSKIKADSQAAVFAVNAGVERLKQNDLAAAIEKFREAIRLDPASAQAHYQLGTALKKRGAVAEARVELDKARQLAQAPPRRN